MTVLWSSRLASRPETRHLSPVEQMRAKLAGWLGQQLISAEQYRHLRALDHRLGREDDEVARLRAVGRAVTAPSWVTSEAFKHDMRAYHLSWAMRPLYLGRDPNPKLYRLPITGS